MDRVLALDAAYPLPLLPGMLEKFAAVEASSTLLDPSPSSIWPQLSPILSSIAATTINRRGSPSIAPAGPAPTKTTFALALPNLGEAHPLACSLTRTP